MRRFLALALLPAVLLSAARAGNAPPKPAFSTQSVVTDADDPAIWVNRRNPSKSLILGTNKSVATEGGGLYVFNLDGKIKQVLGNLDRPNNVDVEYGVRWKNGAVADIAVTTERGRQQLHVYVIKADGSGLKEVAQIKVFQGEPGESFQAPMGVSLYKRPKDGAVFAFVTRKSGPKRGYVWQYRLQDNGNGGLKGTKVRELGDFSGDGECEAVLVDDELGYVYYADESHGIHKWHADPDNLGAGKELAYFARKGYVGDREGIALYAQPGGRGYLVCTDQIEKQSVFYFYKRQGEPGDPHNHERPVKVLRSIGADDTDGIEVTSTALGPRFPKGAFVAMSSGTKNFLVFDWRNVAP